jgi:hypothetical protein
MADANQTTVTQFNFLCLVMLYRTEDSVVLKTNQIAVSHSFL